VIKALKKSGELEKIIQCYTQDADQLKEAK